MAKLSPTSEELLELRKLGHKGPIVMINLLKFRGGGGRELYKDYLAVAKNAGIEGAAAGSPPPKVLYTGRGGQDLADGTDWDWIIITEFANIEQFVRIMELPIYRDEAHPLRERALERAVFMMSFPTENSAL